MADNATPEEVQALADKLQAVEAALNGVILGKETLVREFLTGVLARGHILLEGLPGLGKTQMVRAFARLCDLESRRIQFTPDLMPLDITGSHILREEDGRREFEFHPGPIFGNLILADEINRASPKTQSALLEAMQERRVSILGTTHELPAPFAVLATQNPIELEGTYPLPEAQLDRFLFKLNVTDVPAEVLTRVVTERGDGELPPLEAVVNRDEVLAAMGLVARVLLSAQVANYIARLVRATHREEAADGPAQYVKFGASPRGLSIAMAARARAFLDGRNTVGFEDVKAVARPTLRHRVILDYAARLEGVTQDGVVDGILQAVPELAREAPPTVADRMAESASDA
ncbi:MAG: AAA family ATPase [Planctomycetota bacterium]